MLRSCHQQGGRISQRRVPGRRRVWRGAPDSGRGRQSTPLAGAKVVCRPRGTNALRARARESAGALCCQALPPTRADVRRWLARLPRLAAQSGQPPKARGTSSAHARGNCTRDTRQPSVAVSSGKRCSEGRADRGQAAAAVQHAPSRETQRRAAARGAPPSCAAVASFWRQGAVLTTRGEGANESAVAAGYFRARRAPGARRSAAPCRRFPAARALARSCPRATLRPWRCLVPARRSRPLLSDGGPAEVGRVRRGPGRSDAGRPEPGPGLLDARSGISRLRAARSRFQSAGAHAAGGNQCTRARLARSRSPTQPRGNAPHCVGYSARAGYASVIPHAPGT